MKKEITKSEKNILIAFLLNLSFAIFEFIGGFYTSSIAIISDSIHDLGDAISIGISYLLEKKSKQKPNDKYTYGYVRYSVIGSFISAMILIIGSIFIVYNAIIRIINPVEVNYNGMIIFALFGVFINLIAAYFTKEETSLNQKLVNLHMLEDVFSWVIVLIGAIIISITNITIIDPILSIIVAIYIFKHVLLNLKIIIDLFLEKTPSSISIDLIKEKVSNIPGVKNIHHIHIWSIDGYNNYATMHVITDGKNKQIKNDIKNTLKENNIFHTTIELETEDEHCDDKHCEINKPHSMHHHH